MQTIINILKTARFDNRTGLWLVILPGLISIAVLNNLKYIDNINQIIVIIMLAIIGRGCFCLLNDILDHKLDSKIPRTQFRPIASNNLKISIAIIACVIMACLLLLAGYFILQYHAFLLCLLIGFMCFLYPLAKRFTYYPQLFLGFAINGLVPVIWIVGNNYSINYELIFLYLGMAFFTCAYDTVYGLQDAEYDMAIGYKSMAILALKSQHGAKIYIAKLYLLSCIFFIILTLYVDYTNILRLLMIIIGFGYMICDVTLLKIPNYSYGIRNAITHFKFCVIFELYLILAFIA